MNYIDNYSWKSFLSVQAKDIVQENGFFHWKMKNKTQLIKNKTISENDIPYLRNLVPFSGFYFSKEEVILLKNQPDLKISFSKDPDICIPIPLNLSGKKYSDIRTAVNKCSKLNLTIKNTFNDLQDIKSMLKRWDDTSGERLFQSRTGKNNFFFKNNYHQNCINQFIYLEDKLVSFAVLSPPTNGVSAYIIGKALCLDYPGLSEFSDIMVYQTAHQLGTSIVNLGGGSTKLRKYKLKFPGAFARDSYDGKVEFK